MIPSQNAFDLFVSERALSLLRLLGVRKGLLRQASNNGGPVPRPDNLGIVLVLLLLLVEDTHTYHSVGRGLQEAHWSVHRVLAIWWQCKWGV